MYRAPEKVTVIISTQSNQGQNSDNMVLYVYYICIMCIASVLQGRIQDFHEGGPTYKCHR